MSAGSEHGAEGPAEGPAGGPGGAPGPALRYRIRPADPPAHLFEVELEIPEPDPAGQRLSMAAWIPGSYVIREFAKHVVELGARAGGRPVPVAKLDKSSWRCAPCTGPLVVRYRVYAWELSVRAAHLDTTHGFFNGTSVFLRVHGQEGRPCVVELLPPEGEAYRGWRVATAMPRLEAPPFGFGSYRVSGWEELIDHPVEMGTFDLVTFYPCGYPHHLALTGRHRADLDRLARDLERICAHWIRFFGEPPPMERYLFLVTAVGKGYGGLEHRASSALLCSRRDLPQRHGGAEEHYRTFLGLCSHEYLHTWHVKRIRPAALVGPDLDRERYTRLLWVFEGITTYYQHLSLVRCGLITPEAFLDLLGQLATRVWRSPGRFRQSVAESSLETWTKLYKQDDNAPNAIVSYYTKGALVALCLDLTLRLRSANGCSLDEVMRALWRRHGLTGRPLPEDGFRPLVEEVSGLDLEAFFRDHVEGTAELPLAELLAPFGVRFQLRPAESLDDPGGRPAGLPLEALRRRPSLGVRLAEEGPEARLVHVYEGGAAQRAGLSPGDVLVALDGLRVTRANLDELLATYAPGEEVVVHAFRRDELMPFRVALGRPAEDTCFLSLDPAADGAARARRAAWLEGEG